MKKKIIKSVLNKLNLPITNFCDSLMLFFTKKKFKRTAHKGMESCDVFWIKHYC